LTIIKGFSGCKNLINVKIPNSVTRISARAFYGCDSLARIKLSSNITFIGGYAFYDCDSLTIYCETAGKLSGWDFDWNSSYCPIVWDCNNNEVASDGYIYAFIDSIRYGIKDNTAEVAEQPRNIEGEIFIPESITYKGVVYPVTSIGHEAFAECCSLTSVVIPNSVTSVGYESFYECDSLTIYCETTEQPNGWNDSWNDSECPVVWDCKNSDVAEDECIYTVIGNVRYRIYLGYDGNNKAIVVRQAINIGKDIVIPASITYNGENYPVTSISKEAFYNCSNLKSVKIPNSVKSIGENAFGFCYGLTIYCEVESKPYDWHDCWNYSNCPVIWGDSSNDD